MTKSPNKSRHNPIGRNLALAGQRHSMTPVNRKCAPLTKQLSSRSPTTSPCKMITEAERLECWSAYFNWMANGKKPKDSPIPNLKEK